MSFSGAEKRKKEREEEEKSIVENQTYIEISQARP
jgi:hypothetical protein